MCDFLDDGELLDEGDEDEHETRSMRSSEWYREKLRQIGEKIRALEREEFSQVTEQDDAEGRHRAVEVEQELRKLRTSQRTLAMMWERDDPDGIAD